MRLRELTFPIAIRYPNELEGGRNCFLHSIARFNWTVADAYDDSRFENVEITDSTGHAYRVTKIFFMKPTFWNWFLNRLGHLLILPPSDWRRPIDVDMELEETRTFTLEQFTQEYRELILAHPAWWKRYAKREDMERKFATATTFKEAINEIGSLSPSDNMVYRGKSNKIVDLR